MKHSAFRGCTQLLTPNKAVIIHSLKYRTVSQFWLILFHEIAHLVLHITNPGDVFEDYDDQATDPRETAADERKPIMVPRHPAISPRRHARSDPGTRRHDHLAAVPRTPRWRRRLRTTPAHHLEC